MNQGSGIHPYRVLMVEDNADHVTLLQIAFAQLDPDAHVSVTRNAEEAIAHLQGHWPDDEHGHTPLPDVIVLDINMPGMGGLGFLDWHSRRHDPIGDIPVVVFTSAGGPGLAQQCFALGTREFKEKPADFGELVPVVQRVLDRWRPVGSEECG